jgi:hypothetical protein
MRSTATALPRSSARARTPALARLGATHYAVLVCVLLVYALLFVMLLVPLRQ